MQIARQIDKSQANGDNDDIWEERHTDRDMEKERQRETEPDGDSQTDSQTDRQTDVTQTDKSTYE